MKYKLFLLVLILSACDSNEFDSDKRQIIAKDEIKGLISDAHEFDITSFKEDTVPDYQDTFFKYPIRYTLGFTYKNPTGAVQNKKGIVLFTPDGKSIINSKITDR